MPITASARLLIVDDHPLYGDGLVHLLARGAPQLRCTLARDATQALDLLARGDGIDLVIADQRLPGTLDGLALLEAVGRLRPTAARVLISGQDDPRLPRDARRLGLMGFLPKALDAQVWLDALQSILDGEPWFADTQGAGGANALTTRQAAILAQVAHGRANKAIARDLGVSERTVKYHLAEAYARLGVSGRAQAVARAAAMGWLDLAAR